MRPTLFTLVQRRAPLEVIAARLRDTRLHEWAEKAPSWEIERIRMRFEAASKGPR